MRKTRKFLRFQNIQLIATQEHPKDISRAHLRIIDSSNNNLQYKTFRYGLVEPTKIIWDSTIQLPYLSQESFKFQTLCEHQFGYQIQELKSLYNGTIYIRPDQFFFDSTTHCLNQEGKQCGVLKYMIKVVERQQSRPLQVKEETKEPVKVSLIAKISIYAATLAINSYYSQFFNKPKHRKLSLQIQYKGSTYTGQNKFDQSDYKWNLTTKFEVNEGDPDQIQFLINQENRQYLKGTLHMATLQQNKRFTVQIVELTDLNDQNIAALHIDLRFISKKQLLDLMYSPKQLSQNRKEKDEIKHFELRKRTSSALADIQSHKKLAQLLHSRALSKEIDKKISPSHRYKASLFNDKHQHSIPQSKRFEDRKETNQYISYIDPSIASDFSPNKKRRGATQSSTNKTDFTKNLKSNPGVGQYHLPSIWERK